MGGVEKMAKNVVDIPLEEEVVIIAESLDIGNGTVS